MFNVNLQYQLLMLGVTFIFRLRRFLKGYMREVVLGPTFKLIEAIFELIVPLVMAKIIDVGIVNKDIGYIYKMGGVMLLLGALGLGFSLMCQFFAARASQGFGTALRNEIFHHVNTLSHEDLDKIGAPSLITRITNDVNQVQFGFAMLIRLATRAPFLIIGAAAMALMIDLKIGIIFLLIVPFVAVMLFFIMSRSVPLYRVIQKKLDRIALITKENLDGLRIIRAFAKEERECGRFKSATDDAFKSSVTVGKIAALLNPLTYIIMNFGVIAVLWFGGIRVNEGGLLTGEVVALVNYMTQISLTLVALASLIVTLSKAAASAVRVNEVLAMAPSVVESSAPATAPAREIVAKLVFDDVSFSYNRNKEYAISHISFCVNSGETLGIIGGTGSGKSTLVGLIPRFYDIDSGRVLIDGQDIRSFSFKTLRQKLGLVPQQAALFSGSIGENLRLGEAEATDEMLEKAIGLAQATDFVNAQGGFGAPVSQGGRSLSGGQKQRLCIARAVVSHPEILILDDSSSALDAATGVALRQALADYDGTVVMISQRVNSIRFADKIIVLDNGCLVGEGTHSELLESCEIYREIVASQESAEVSI